MIGAAAAATVDRVPGATAVVALATGERLTYRQLWDAATRVAGGLAQAGVRPGERVAVKLPNGSPWCLAVLGAMLADLAAERQVETAHPTVTALHDAGRSH